MFIHASAFARIWKPDALIGYAFRRSFHPPLLSRWNLNSSSRHEKHILNGVLPTTNLHPPIRFYRCVSTKMLFCVLDGVITALWHLSHADVCVQTDLRLISCAYKGASVWWALMCMLDIIQTTTLHKIHLEMRHSRRFESHIAVEVCPYLPYVIFLMAVLFELFAVCLVGNTGYYYVMDTYVV